MTVEELITKLNKYDQTKQIYIRDNFSGNTSTIENIEAVVLDSETQSLYEDYNSKQDKRTKAIAIITNQQ